MRKNLFADGACKHLKRGMSVLACAALAASMVPAAAFASVGSSGVYYTLPTQSMGVTHTNSDGSTYEYLTTSHSRPPYAIPAYCMLGVDNVGISSLPEADAVENGTIAATKARNAVTVGLFGSDANQNPDEYLYNYAAYINGVNVPENIRALNSSSSKNVEVNGTAYANMPYEIYMECNILNTTSDTKSGDYTYAQWVEIENQRDGGRNDGKYDPTYAKWSVGSGGAAAIAESLYSVAETMDGIIESSKNSNGQYTLKTRYADGANTTDVVATYEDFIKGIQYYLLKKIDDGSIEKKTAAIICGYDPNTHNYACRTFGVDEADPDTNKYGGRMANSAAQVCNNITDLGLPTAQAVYDQEKEGDYVRWYTPEQIVENCDAVFTCDAPGSNSVSNYLASDSTGKANTVYALNGSNLNDETGDANMQDLIAAQASAKAAGKQAADLCYKWPATVFGCLYAQGCEIPILSVVECAYLYPEYFDITDMMAYWIKNVWHVKGGATVQDMVDSVCYDISLSSNQSKVGTVSSNYEDEIGNMIYEGNVYYLAHTTEVDAINGGNIKTYSVEALTKRVQEYAATHPVTEQTIKVKPASKTIKASAVKKKAKTYTFKVSGAKTALTAKAANSKSKKVLTVKASGKTKVKITVKKGTKKGTYKAKVRAKLAGTYKASAYKTITIKVK